MFSGVAHWLPISRRALIALPIVHVTQRQRGERDEALAAAIDREPIATVERVDGLSPPLTLGIARVVLRPGASALAATPDGARIIVVESGVLAIASVSQGKQPLTAAQLTAGDPAPGSGDELFVPAGTAMAFGALGVASVRNPGARSVVALDIAVYREEPRPLSRAFTTEDGISFQLLANGNATAAPKGRVVVALERLRLGARSGLPPDVSVGLTLMYVEAGSLELSPVAGEVFSARAAASAPYSMPGALQPIPIGEQREVTAGGVVFLPVGAEAGVENPAARPAEVLALAVRAVD